MTMKCSMVETTLRLNLDSIQLVTNLLTDVTLCDATFQYPGIEPTLTLTKPPIVFSHMTGESTYRTQTTAADSRNV